MSRSKHQRHDTHDILGYTEEYYRCKKLGIRCDYHNEFKWRKRKLKPYGLKLFTGYGGESYSHKYKIEFLSPIINKKSKRQKLKKDLKDQINNVCE